LKIKISKITCKQLRSLTSDQTTKTSNRVIHLMRLIQIPKIYQ
jgi:hypothetical protein